MSDFAGDFVLQPDTPDTTDSERERAPRMPNWEAMKAMNPGRNPVVANCIHAAAKAYAEGYFSGQCEDFCILVAKAAFGASMPDPVGEWNTRDFIACVAYGIHSSMIDTETAARLLYAAQVALTGVSQKRKS